MKQNKEIAQKWMRYVSAGDIESICSITDSQWIMHGALPDLPPGPDGVRKLFNSFGHVQQEWVIEDIIAEDEKVIVRATNFCQQESFLGIPANGRAQIFSAIFIHHIVNGKIVETWRNADDLGRVLQLGATIIPPSQQELQEDVFSMTMKTLKEVKGY